MIDFTLASGVVLHITPAPWQDQVALFKAIMREAKSMNSEADVSLAVFTSDEVERAMYKCAARADYNGARVTPGLFDEGSDEVQKKVRKDYIEIVKKIIEVNCEPFFHPASSESSAPAQTPTPNIPK